MIKKQISNYIINRNLKGKEFIKQSFSGFLNKSYSFFILMPEDELDFYQSITILNYLDANQKNIQVFTHDFRVSLLPIKLRRFTIDYGVEDITKLNLPSKNLIDKLTNLNVNTVIDLNRKNELFYSYSASLINSPIKIGMKKNNSDNYYNLQFANSEDNSEMFYKNFLNFLEMF